MSYVKVVLLLLSSLSLALPSMSNASPGEREHEDDNGIIIFDGTRDPSAPVLATNLPTGLEDDVPAGVTACDDDEAIELNICNGFENNNIQMITGSQSGLLANIGINHPDTTSYNNRGTARQFDLFGEDHLFDIDRFRYAAGQLALRDSTAPAGTYGTISWEQFVRNVANGQTMYGIVRVLVPLTRIDEKEEHSSRQTYPDSPLVKVGAFSKDSYYRYKSSQRKKKTGRYGLCRKDQPKSKCGCAPTRETELEPGATVCGIKLGTDAKIDVRGALLIDFVDCEDMKPLARQNISTDIDRFEVEIGVPILINPANPAADGTLRHIDQIAQLTRNLRCAENQVHCTLPVSASIGWSLISQQAKDRWFSQQQTRLTRARFNQLSPTEQYQLLLPSGYAQGWKQAFDMLNLTRDDWRSLGFGAPAGDDAFTLADIHSEAFEDIPVYMYSGGIVKMGFHLNISGLVYIPQALELEQEDTEILRCEPYEHHSDDEHGYEHKSDDCHEETEIDARQYVAGSIVVRDAFFIEAEHGTTLISNQPDTYSTMRVAGNSGLAGRFNPVSGTAVTTDSQTRQANDDNDDDRNEQADNSQRRTSDRPGIEWVEIRP